MPRLTREQSREITREKLRASAIRQISATGFVGASIDRICEGAGFSRGAFYANFSSKDDLLLDVVRGYHGREAEKWIAQLRSERPLGELMPLLRERFAAYLSDHPRILFFTEVQLYAKRNPPFLQRYKEEFMTMDFKAEQILEALYLKAGKSPHRPLAALAQTMRGLMSGLVLDITGGTEEAGRSSDLLIAFLEDLLALGSSRIATGAVSADRPAG